LLSVEGVPRTASAIALSPEQEAELRVVDVADARHVYGYESTRKPTAAAPVFLVRGRST
jgi:hypothetical protein